MTKPQTQDKVNGALPAGAARIMRLVERSQPSVERPRISEEFEAQLQPVHVKSAACYASMEDLGDKMERLAELIDDDESVVIGELAEDDNSVVTHIDEVANELRDTRTRLAAMAPTSTSTPHDGTRPAKEDDGTNGATQPASLRERALTH